MESNELDSKYIARCHKRLKEWGAPLEGWYCTGVSDIAGENYDDDVELATCELCDCHKVRFVHTMMHDEYFEPVDVGCICAGIMEGDILAAKERERVLRNRSKRRQHFPERRWAPTEYGSWSTKYQGERVYINRSKYKANHYGVYANGTSSWQYKGKPITDFISAAYAAFDLADPVDKDVIL